MPTPTPTPMAVPLDPDAGAAAALEPESVVVAAAAAAAAPVLVLEDCVMEALGVEKVAGLLMMVWVYGLESKVCTSWLASHVQPPLQQYASSVVLQLNIRFPNLFWTTVRAREAHMSAKLRLV